MFLDSSTATRHKRKSVNACSFAEIKATLEFCFPLPFLSFVLLNLPFHSSFALFSSLRRESATVTNADKEASDPDTSLHLNNGTT